MSVKKYSRDKKIRKGTALALAIALMVVAGAAWKLCAAEEPAWDVCYEMTNRNIEWTYAGR